MSQNILAFEGRTLRISVGEGKVSLQESRSLLVPLSPGPHHVQFRVGDQECPPASQSETLNGTAVLLSAANQLPPFAAAERRAMCPLRARLGRKVRAAEYCI